MIEQNNFITPSSNNTEYNNIKVLEYGFYLNKQQYLDECGNTNEVIAILTVKINNIKLDGKDINSIDIYFRSKGALKKPTFLQNNSFKLEKDSEELNSWLIGLSNSTKYLDINNYGSGYFSIFLYSGEKI